MSKKTAISGVLKRALLTQAEKGIPQVRRLTGTYTELLQEKAVHKEG